MDARSLGGLIVVVGVIIVILGVLVATGALGWFGRLPGDVRIEGKNTRVYIPITSMLLVSLVLTLAASIWRRFF